jgi:hypothetical protein
MAGMRQLQEHIVALAADGLGTSKRPESHPIRCAAQ